MFSDLFFAVDCARNSAEELFSAIASESRDKKFEQPADREDDRQRVHDGLRKSADDARQHVASPLDSLRQSRTDWSGKQQQVLIIIL